MIYGIDVDGVLADFNDAYITCVIDVAGKDRFPPRPFDIPTWNYPEHYGYSKDVVSASWAQIKADPMFWQRLPSYPHTERMLFHLLKLTYKRNDIYFITARVGVDVKVQTERWLQAYAWGGFAIDKPTVLISSDKGGCAKALHLDYYIDDKTENCEDVVSRSPSTTVHLFDQPWNRTRDVAGAVRVFADSDCLFAVPRAEAT